MQILASNYQWSGSTCVLFGSSVIQPSNLAIVGLATGLLGQLGQGVGKAATLFADLAAAPFHAVMDDKKTGLEESTPSSSSAEAGISSAEGFAGLYSQFEQAITRFLAGHPDLPKLRIQISDDSKIRLQPAKPSDSDPEMARRLAEIQDAVNRDHRLSRMANQLYESKSLERWRSGLVDRPADVELIVEAH